MRSLFLVFLLACSSDGSGGDAGPGVPAMITFAGQAAAVSSAGMTPMASLEIRAYDRDDEVTPIATAVTDQLGNFALSLPTGGEAFDGYLRASAADFVDTYLYAPHALSASYERAPLRMTSAATLALLANVCVASQLPNQGTVAAIATDGAGTSIAGVTLASTPAANKDCYNDASGWPSSVQLTTGGDGVGYLFNVIGPVTVSATKPGSAFAPRLVTARPGVVTMVLLAP